MTTPVFLDGSNASETAAISDNGPCPPPLMYGKGRVGFSIQQQPNVLPLIAVKNQKTGWFAQYEITQHHGIATANKRHDLIIEVVRPG